MIKLSADEFITKLLQGERDFRKVNLDHANLTQHEQYEKLIVHLKKTT